ncbi:unnamed protein product [Rotaria magnacalcarata]|uniref:B box-type domain-containing protein n=2 Tax=Rotaria magnacalcarata TaxID=392030 RepID=A0A815PJH8_9BILA|nr:unnamed protein product [Rotaria magnacalcarata]
MTKMKEICCEQINLHDSCVKRGKNGGIFFCNGCQRTLCFKHVNEHRDEIEKQFEDLINQKNQIENDISIRDDSQYLFNEIEQWKRENIEQIKKIAKQDLRKLNDESKEILLKNCQELKENLCLLNESEDLSEIKLIKLSNKLNSLKKQINSFELVESSNSIFVEVEKKKEMKFFK